ncbi:MAG: hypothetical protein A3F84_28315 [Candidatus Handelsmanbacteria bacterium RIFCSPLOWO2_12_FULL_64_10]|uniref:Bacterial type II secretion system protein E domain-containing protein n=1 Tax=Handelsmanbacteria sp. (strain RIFCSPLOWO2_12_FULL_64_10) TaxID=1817868 RepID=A0A1F6D4W9_HANXR|nr:MAG: hypothetical protein A3F84_28315 [Candidatus Handelsmanbacteria bacterium RIFCSPLOWO2_12_FULL_64_10]
MRHEDHNREILKGFNNPKREERALSLLDLIELRTFDLDLAAWFVSLVSRGASYITGSGPGGVGKTTTMRSLLSFVPDNLRFAIALPGEVSAIDGVPHCVISNELSDHPPPTYLWGQNLRDFFALSGQGHLLVGNVHADGLKEVRGQIVETNHVPESQFRAVNLLVFICLEGGNPPGGRVKDRTTRRVIHKIFYSDGASEHEPVYTLENGLTPSAPRDPDDEKLCRAFLEETLNSPERTLEGVRHRFLEWKKNNDGRPYGNPLPPPPRPDRR